MRRRVWTTKSSATELTALKRTQPGMIFALNENSAGTLTINGGMPATTVGITITTGIRTLAAPAIRLDLASSR
jgi:hypothetical protein